jgi:transposase-like protein
MKKTTAELISEIKQVHGQYLDEVGRGGHKVWPKSIKERVLELAESLGSAKQAAELCGISAHTIYQWRLFSKHNQFRALAVVDNKPRSPTVTVTNRGAPLSNRILKTESPTVTVTTPDGYIVKGLSAKQVLEFLLKRGAR